MDDCWLPLDDEWEARCGEFLDNVEAGRISYHEQLPIARQMYWELANKQRLPEGYWLRHKADCSPACVNPDHAELVKVGL